MIKENVARIFNELPPSVSLVSAAKGRSVSEIKEAIEAGVKIIGENYVQEAEKAFLKIGNIVKWHFIGHLQKNKVKKAVNIFNMIETVDSFELAEEINKRSSEASKVMLILLEINSGSEVQKFGVLPEDAESLIRKISELKSVKILGLMTMGPFSDDAETVRPFFVKTRKLFDKIKTLNIPNVEMKILSMGMSDSYKIAIQEGANLVRIGTKIFGERK
jgi:pyridoxal phosphate enzyme (YggS family)